MPILSNPLHYFTHDLAIDLGTANTLVYVRGRGIVLDEPSVVAVRQVGAHREVVAVGADAKQMLGRTPEAISAVRPLKEGIIADYVVAEAMLRHFISRALGHRSPVRPRIVVCIPTGLAEVEQRAVQESARASGAREVYLIPQPLAAALGADLPVMEPRGTFICDIGGGTSEMAVISLGGIVTRRSLRVAGDRMDEVLIEWIRDRHRVLIGERTAEALKQAVGCSRPSDQARAYTVKGRDLASGIPRSVDVSSEEASRALFTVIEQIIETIRITLSETPPELVADILDAGIVLTGGGALLNGIEDVLREATRLPVVAVPDPLRSVVIGAGHALEDPTILERIAL